ncbi:PD-(D/E)XK motif protein [Nocardioides sp. GY 10127]|uniref:PD-(D/E)XK motif protein n=1 Tax=Nocardioides sp. GY 10127 TaxID=2569762 RepID=UPI0010A82D8D|nr:PD-(D/E)XK motif protein [Nocardioides sp. GY 10127]TIC84441.1 PD-(D/E)XK motif protein [Nocardioides sp. GY 10127]
MTTVTGRDLVDELAKVVAPTSSGFSVRDVPSAPGYKVGRGADGAVALLTPPDAAPEPPTRLRTLQLEPRALVRFDAEDGSSVEAEHGVVQLWLQSDELLEPFLGVAATIVRLLGPDPAPGEVSAGLRRLVRIFDPAQPPRSSVLGLWAELLVIDLARDTAAMVDAWHAHVDARFDFSADGSRLEVKATSKDVRVHQVNLRQLLPVVGAETMLASVMTTETRAGTSLAALVDRIEQRLVGDTPRQVVLHEVVADTLGTDWVRHVGRRFDEKQGRESLAFLDPATVPQVGDVPPEVLEVLLTVDCTDVPQVRPTTGLAALVASRPA